MSFLEVFVLKYKYLDFKNILKPSVNFNFNFWVDNLKSIYEKQDQDETGLSWKLINLIVELRNKELSIITFEKHFEVRFNGLWTDNNLMIVSRRFFLLKQSKENKKCWWR